MFDVSKPQAAAIRAAFDEGGEFSAAVELRRMFPAVTDNDKAREHVRIILGLPPPLPPSEPTAPPCTVTRLPPGKARPDG
jgi:hypothetical protein